MLELPVAEFNFLLWVVNQSNPGCYFILENTYILLQVNASRFMLQTTNLAEILKCACQLEKFPLRGGGLYN